MNAERPVSIVRYIDANGRLTQEGMIYFQKLVDVIRDLEVRLAALEP